MRLQFTRRDYSSSSCFAILDSEVWPLCGQRMTKMDQPENKTDAGASASHTGNEKKGMPLERCIMFVSVTLNFFNCPRTIFFLENLRLFGWIRRYAMLNITILTPFLRIVHFHKFKLNKRKHSQQL